MIQMNTSKPEGRNSGEGDSNATRGVGVGYGCERGTGKYNTVH